MFFWTRVMPNHNSKLMEELINQDRDRFKRLYKFISRGVKIIDVFTTHIAENVKISKGTIIYPLTVIESDVQIGRNCCIGPFARIRSGTRLKDRAVIGNFVEVVRSNIGSGSKVKHLTYIGDAAVDKNVNVGAGTVIANYDGKFKNKTKICSGAFIGSGSILIAPVKVGRQAVTGAGSVVTKGKDVPAQSVVVGIPAKVLKMKRKAGEK